MFFVDRESKIGEFRAQSDLNSKKQKIKQRSLMEMTKNYSKKIKSLKTVKIEHSAEINKKTHLKKLEGFFNVSAQESLF